MADYDFKSIEARWQTRWAEAKAFETGGTAAGRPRFYCLEMLPYPSGRLHMGHVRNYTIGDAVAHFQRLAGRDVLHPMGWDALGLPAENAAIERGIHPRDWTLSNIEFMRRQLQDLGLSYAWSREVATCLPEYYRWNQWFFLRMLERDLVYRSRRLLNWCPKCATVLANEQVEGGRCWRHEDTEVQPREMDQWFIRITRYADELDRCLDGMTEWPESVRTMQRNWIGRSVGTRVRFAIDGLGRSIEVFTTRIDTIYGATFLVIAPDHPLLEQLIAGTGRETEVRGFVASLREQARKDRFAEPEKTGIATSRAAINPFSGERMPIWVANYVLMEYGTGAIMAVPAHDERDFEFAGTYGLPVRQVIRPSDGVAAPSGACTADEGGILVNSGSFDGLPAPEARRKMAESARERGFGEEAVSYRLRDWGISRQRYWGTPIPIVYCDRCGTVPVPDAELPVLLPEVNLRGITGAPLAAVPEFVHTSCPRCGGPGRRETDTMDTFMDSSWYFDRYLDPRDEEQPFARESAQAWLPIDLYVGGITHATGHLIYCRFFHKFLRDLGLVAGDEPIRRLLTQGMVVCYSYFCEEHRYISPDEVRSVGEGDSARALCPHDGRELVRTLGAMSKSKNNAPNLDRIMERYGADTVRLYVLFAAPPEDQVLWSEQGIEGCHRFLSRVWRFYDRHAAAMRGASDPGGDGAGPASAETAALRRKTHQTIARVTEDIGRRLHLNTAIAAIMELVNTLYGFYERDDFDPAEASALREAFDALCRLLVPLAPHLAEEIHAGLGLDGLAVRSSWPQAAPALLREETVQIIVQVAGKLRGRIEVPREAGEAAVIEAAQRDERVVAALQGRPVARTVFVPGRILNIVPG